MRRVSDLNISVSSSEVLLHFIVVAIAQLVEPWIVIPVVVGSSPISHPKFTAMVAELVDALASGVSVFTDVRVQVPPFALMLQRLQHSQMSGE